MSQATGCPEIVPLSEEVERAAGSFAGSFLPAQLATVIAQPGAERRLCNGQGLERPRKLLEAEVSGQPCFVSPMCSETGFGSVLLTCVCALADT